MLTHNMILVLAKNGGSLATKLAQNKSVKKATAKQLDAVVGNLALSVTAGGTAALRRPVANRKNRRLADQVARQIIGGTCDRRVIAGDWYWVVWQDETPFDVSRPWIRA